MPTPVYSTLRHGQSIALVPGLDRRNEDGEEKAKAASVLW